MIKYFLILIVLLISFVSCSKQQNTYALSDEQLVNVLADLHILEFMLKRKDNISSDSIKFIFYKDMESIYKQPKEIILENVERLRNNPEKYNVLYNEVAKVLEEEMVSSRKESLDTELQDIE